MINLGKILKEGVTIASVIIFTALVGYCAYNEISQGAKKKVECILDENENGILSSEEIKKFYDVTGITPYIKESFDKLPSKSFDDFLQKYE